MSTRTAHWVSRTNPGSAPPPAPSRAYTTAPPPTIYPESSVSNPNASRYTGRSSRASSAHSGSHARSRSAGPASSHHSHASSHHSGSHYSGSQHSGSRTATPSGSYDGRPMQTYYAPSQQPIIARTSTSNGKTSSYMIIPPAGQKVEILNATPARSQTMPLSAAGGSSHYSYASPAKEKPLIKRLFDKVEWPSGSAAGKSSASRSSRSSTRSRRNSTGTARIITAGASGTQVTASGTRVTSGSGRIYDITYV